MNFSEFCMDPNLVGHWYGGATPDTPDTWDTWRVVHKAIGGEPLNETERMPGGVGVSCVGMRSGS